MNKPINPDLKNRLMAAGLERLNQTFKMETRSIFIPKPGERY